MSTTEGQGRRVLAGRYVLRGLLGQGGMADVELAYDEVLDREVAVKMLHERYAGDSKFIERFRREAQNAAALNHPNVVGIYDTGADGGRPFIVMEYVSGRSLRDVMRDDGIVPRRAAEIAAEAGRALHFAHERGIVHRDVKPANIMVADDGRVKVADFGIARAVNVSVEERLTQTNDGVYATAAYVAPEQAKGEEVDGRTDLYALGCVLFEMITGQQPFLGDTAVALAYKHVQEPPPSPRSLNPQIPASLEAVVLKAMAKEPAQRYQTGKDFADDLARTIAGQRTSAEQDASAGGAAFAPTQAITRQQAAQQVPVTDQTMVAAPIPRPIPVAEEVAEEYYTRNGPDYGRIAGYAFMFVLIGVLVGVAFFLFNDITQDDPVAQVTVPALVNQDIAVAEQSLIAVGLQPQAIPEENPDVPSGTVLRTEPAGGMVVDEGSTVLLYVASEPGDVPVPDLTNLTEAEAEAALVELGLAVGEIERAPSDEIEEGRVIESDPRTGVPLPLGSLVSLTISRGEGTFVMPNVVGLTAEEARRAIEIACLPEGEEPCALVRQQIDPQASGDEERVVESDPPAGEDVQEGQNVVIILPPAGPTETPEPTQTEEPEPIETEEPEPTTEPEPTQPQPTTPPPEPTTNPQPTPQPRPTVPPPTGAPTVPPQSG